ncbi:MAG: glycine cleavage system protein GcvH [Candidatus Lokiarchaeota archaeon]|nr:glycine cleavage system protein GcvH [Candidatus Lokiarchaeota archaeon]
MDHEFPDSLKYTSTHEWIRIEDSTATVGITDYAQHQLGDIVFVELPEVSMVFEKGSNAVEIESVKAVGDLIMPLSGEIIGVNQNLADNPELVNSSPFIDGWIIKIKYSQASEIDELLSAENYKQLIQNEEH